MESPPSFSAHSEAPLLSEDSGLIVTSGSVSSDSVSGWLPITSELQESDYDEKSLSLYDSQDASERMCADNFNTVKKGPAKILIPAIDPPPQFQDSPTSSKHSNSSDDQKCQILEKGDSRVPKLSMSMLGDAAIVCHKMCCDKQHCMKRYASPRLIHLSPCHVTVRPVSRSSLTSRLSSSHNSLTTQPQTDDSSFITQAISHDTLSVTASDIADMYNVPFDSDIYAVPIDTVRPSRSARLRNKRLQRDYRNRGKSICQSITSPSPDKRPPKFSRANSKTCESTHEDETKRHSIPGTSSNEHSLPAVTEPMHMTLQEVRKYLHALYSSSSESESKTNLHTLKSGKTKTKTSNSSNNIINNNNVRYNFPEGESDAVSKNNIESDNNLRKNKKNSLSISVKNMKKPKDVIQLKEINEEIKAEPTIKPTRSKKSPVKNLKQTLCNFFKLRRVRSAEGSESEEQSRGQGSSSGRGVVGARRALPPLPPSDISTPARLTATDTPIDFTTSIQKVKDYGWYWGPLSVEAAERILSDEPDGSFIVRDSSDDHYIFTLTFKLNGMRHVRIEHDQGNFCFGSCTMFKAHTIVEFIENAVETSRSGRYLFFLNLRPVLGPMRVQLLYPVSRFKRVQSLQHMCRFVILKVVRRDLISNLPLPRRLLDYLSTPHYYSETLMDS